MSTLTAESPVVKVSVSPQKQQRQPQATLFRVIWRWHFYAGIIVSPFLMIVALTGAIYLFSAEIIDAANREHIFISGTPKLETASFSSLIENAIGVIPNSAATRLSTFADPQRTATVFVTPPPNEGVQKEPSRGRGRRDDITVFVNPYTAKVIGRSDGPQPLDGFFRVVLQIHRQLFIGTTGRIVVELVSSWSLLLFLSGVYLWWPRRKEKVKGVWLPRWSAKSYTLLRDLHALAGLYLLPICLTIIISGLFYTLVWGESFHLVTKHFFATSTASDTEENKPAQDTKEPYIPPTFSIDQAMTTARSLYANRDITVTLPKGSTDHYDVSAINDYARNTSGSMDSTGFKLHRDTGEVLDVQHLSDNERYWWHSWAYPLHVGSVFGLTSKLLWLAACLVLIALPFTGLWMWWKRRPPGQSGFPRSTPFTIVPRALWATILLLTLLLPTFGLSVLVIALAEWTLHYSRNAPHLSPK